MVKLTDILKWFKTVFHEPTNTRSASIVDEAWQNFEKRTTAALEAEPFFDLAEAVYSDLTSADGPYRDDPEAKDDPRLWLELSYSASEYGTSVTFRVNDCEGFDCAGFVMEAWVERGYKVTYIQDNTWRPSREFVMREVDPDTGEEFDQLFKVKVDACLTSDESKRLCKLVGTGEYTVTEKKRFDCPQTIKDVNASLGVEAHEFDA